MHLQKRLLSPGRANAALYDFYDKPLDAKNNFLSGYGLSFRVQFTARAY
jgi:hypothetical protein